MEQASRDHMRRLVDRLNETARAYYVDDAPIISDAEWDALYDELRTLEEASGVRLADSPTRRVGGEPLSAFTPYRHEVRLWSMDKAQSEMALREWAARAQRLWQVAVDRGESLPPIEYEVEYKFDGLTISLTYDGGTLVKAATRGNGEVGEAILEQVRTIRSIPLKIPFTGHLVVQGEGIMKLSVLAAYNRTAAEPLKNARNGAAGALRNLDPAVTARRRLDAFMYNVSVIEGRTLVTQLDALDFLREMGFPVSPMHRHAASIDEAVSVLAEIALARETLDFLIDGAVIKINDLKTHQALGYTDKFPRWAVAYKFEAEETTTLLRDVTWELGRTGKLTPLAHLEPVELAGVTVSRATLNNWGDIVKKRVRIGARVWVRRSGDVIPEILGRVDEAMPGERDIERPTVCPACGTPVVERGANLFCDSPDCKPRVVAALAHFASRSAMDIETFSEKTAALLYDAVGLREPSGLYDLTSDQLVGLKGMGEKKAQNLLLAIAQSKDRPLDAFLYGLGIPGVGRKTARDLAEHFGTLEAVRAADIDTLVSIPEIGGIIAQNIADYFTDPVQAGVVDRLLIHGVQPQPMEKAAEQDAPGPLAGMAVVVTGTLETMGRQEAEAAIARAGGRPAGSVSKKTALVVAGASAGSKLEKARALGIRVVDEEAFRALLGGFAPERSG